MKGIGTDGGRREESGERERERKEVWWVGDESLLNRSRMSYKSKGFQIGALAGVLCKK
jgi:hypothetical protein